jgi:protein-S-isoprenylcysteine O-methyltransferase Ste14
MHKITEQPTTETTASWQQGFPHSSGKPETGRTQTRSKGILFYGCFCYLIFLATFLCAIGFLANLFPRAMDLVGAPFRWSSVWIDLALLTVFALQHSIMARPWFKRAWTRFVPAAGERSTYVLFSSIALLALFFLWQPMGILIWDIHDAWVGVAIYSLYAAGWLGLLVSTFLINHFDLFGLRQAYAQPARQVEHLAFRTPAFYRFVRHPIYVSWLVIFWAAPTMTLAHLLFAIVTTLYILAAIPLEERDLVTLYGEVYRSYQQAVPKLIPRPWRKYTGPNHATPEHAA